MLLILRTIFRFTLRIILGFILFVLSFLFCSWLLPKIHVNQDFQQAQNGIDIYIKSNGVHTDVVVPVANEHHDWKKLFPPHEFNYADSTYQYLAFGWGDKGFYLDTPTWDDLKFSTAVKAAFYLGSTAMHVTYHKHKLTEDTLCKKISISVDQYKELIKYIHSSFELNANNYIRINHPGYGDHDKFYEALGTYGFTKTCNCWSGKALKTIGVKVGYWTPFQGGLLESIR